VVCNDLAGTTRHRSLSHRTLVTPPAALHSHHNEGHGPRARFLIGQDGGLYYHGRTMGFAFADDSRNAEP